MASKQRAIYWDTSVFLCFLRKHESERRAICEDILRHAHDGKVSLYTSSFTVTEVIKPLRMETTGPRPLSSDEVEDLQGMFHWPWLKKIALDHRVAQDAVNLGLNFP
jgi:predicted nucleic acid-binding protein